MSCHTIITAITASQFDDKGFTHILVVVVVVVSDTGDDILLLVVVCVWCA